jgi:hypothetical protein
MNRKYKLTNYCYHGNQTASFRIWDKKNFFPKNLKELYKRLSVICFRQVSIERIQLSSIHIPPCSQEIVENDNPNFLRDGKLIKILKEHLYWLWLLWLQLHYRTHFISVFKSLNLHFCHTDFSNLKINKS